MESFHQNEIIFYGFVLLLSIILICLWAVSDKTKENNNKKKYKTLPEPEGTWPIIGHLRLLQQQHQLLHRALGDLADKYGPAFGIRLGAKRAFVVSNCKVAKECYTVNDKVFSSRASNLALKLIGYADISLGFAQYGQHWRDMRRMAVTQLLSVHRVEQHKDIRETEINSLLGGLYKKCVELGGSTSVELKEMFWHFATNIILRSVAGNRFEETDGAESRQCKKPVRDLNHLIGLLFVSDAVPFLGWLDTVSGRVGEVQRTVNKLDNFLQRWVEEHRHNKLVGEIDGRKQDFMDIMLSAMDNGRPAEEVDRIIKATCMILVVPGSDNPALTLTWATSLLLNDNRVLKKAQEELDTNVGTHRQVEESDINNLVYIKAIIKETLRLYPPAPLSVPRLAMEDCEVGGYYIPKGSQLLVNLWKIHRDPTVWKNPSKFIPERFLEEHSHLDVKGKDFEYMPFGSGRRICPAITFGSQVVHLALARLIHAFEFNTVSGKPMDMKEGVGLNLPKEAQLEDAHTKIGSKTLCHLEFYQQCLSQTIIGS